METLNFMSRITMSEQAESALVTYVDDSSRLIKVCDEVSTLTMSALLDSKIDVEEY